MSRSSGSGDASSRRRGEDDDEDVSSLYDFGFRLLTGISKWLPLSCTA